MASNFKVIGDSEFRDQTINGSNFSLNPTRYNTILKGNVGDIIKLTQTIEVRTSYNLGLDKTAVLQEMTWDASNMSIVIPDDWFTEGFYPSASVEVTNNATALNTTITILSISGVGNGEITISATDGAAIQALGFTYETTTPNMQFKLLSVPTYINYKYGLNPVGYVGESYQSPFDSNIQCYYSNSIPTTPTTATGIFLGGEQSANLGDFDVSFIATVATYRHQIQINHTFKIPYYISGQIPNLEGVTAPEDYTGTNTYRYDNRFELGTPTYNNSVFVNFGALGSVGYFNENFNGLVNDYTISELTITNASGTGVLEATEANTVYFKITSATDNFQSGIKLIAGHSKLPITTEYQNKVTPFDDIWIFENLQTTEGAGTASGTLITDFEVNIDAPKVLECEFVVTYSADQQELIDTDKNSLLWITVANKDITDAELIDRVNLVIDVNNFSKNKDVSGLLLNNVCSYYPSYSAFTGTNYTNFTGGDGDLWGSEINISLNKLANARIISANFKILADNGTNTMELSNTYFPIYPIEEYFDGIRFNQVLNFDIANNLNLPSDDPLNRLFGNISASVGAVTEQPAQFKCGFQTPWRDWIENLNISMEFYDIAEPNNNRNYKTSNYSGLLSYAIYGVWQFEVTNDTYPDTPTVYNVYSDPSTVIEFDSASWSMTSAAVTLETLDGDPATSIENGQDLIVKIEFTHALGILSLNTLDGFVWIERNGSTLAPFYLATHSDWTSEDNWLQPSDTLATGNYQFVEMESVLNLVTFTFKTNSDNINTVGIDANIYGRLWKK